MRGVWHPVFARLYGRQPETMWDLTPLEINAMVEDVKLALNNPVLR